MKLMKGKDVSLKEEKNPEKIIYPENLDLKSDDTLMDILFYTFQSIVDKEDYDEFMKIFAKNFYEKNKNILDELSNLGEDNLEKIWDILNKLLNFYNFGKSRILINLKNKEILIHHYKSPFVGLVEREDKMCQFLSTLYSEILSVIFEENIGVSEKECANEGKTEYCIFNAFKMD
jgi:predicted hydrocarbon binding protein